MRHDHNCSCTRCFDLNYTSTEEFEAASSIYDNVLAGTHEQIQAEAVEWLRNFKNPNDTKRR